MFPRAMLPTTEAGGVQLCVAEPSDASQIFSLANRVFGDKQFLYTVYQSPQSLRHVERLITAGGNNHRFVLLKRDVELLGYYEALLRDGTCFLNYIATDPSVSGQGYGQLLLEDFEAMGRDSGCRHLSLDVFQSNSRAVAWYRQLGFWEESVTYLARIALRDVPKNNHVGLKIDKEEMDAALAEERDWGFSKVVCDCGDGRISLGFIAGRCCKVLDLHGITLRKAVDAIVVSMRNERDVLIVSSEKPVQLDHDIVSSETVLRMTKPLAANQE